MIPIQLNICEEESEFFYEMGTGEIENLYLVDCDGDAHNVNELLLLSSVTECITDHFDNLKLSEDL